MKKAHIPPITKNMKSNNPIRGLGNDIMRSTGCGKHRPHGLHFLNRLFTQREQDYCYKFKDPVPTSQDDSQPKNRSSRPWEPDSAPCFLARHRSVNDETWKPIVLISEALQKRFDHPHLLVSISHSSTHATAVAIWS